MALSQADVGNDLIGDWIAAAIAHEVRQPLSAIVMSATAGFRFLDQSPPDLDQAKQAFKRIEDDGHRAGSMVADIRANFRSDPRKVAGLDIDELIRGVIAMKRSDLERHQVLVHVEAGRQLPQVRGSRIQLQQVLLNLIANSIDAMATTSGHRELSMKVSEHVGDRILVTVSDTGSGVGSDAIDRIFDPLFTTKPNGMGMGLVICRAIIETHGGKLWFMPNAPKGAVFQFLLPVQSSTLG